jgi:hypothetical protein
MAADRQHDRPLPGNPNTNSNADDHTDTYTYTHADTYPNAYTDTNTNANSDRDTGITDTDRDGYTNCHANTFAVRRLADFHAELRWRNCPSAASRMDNCGHWIWAAMGHLHDPSCERTQRCVYPGCLECR